MKTLTDLLNDHLDVRAKMGDEWLCVCPFHEDTNPSFSVNVKKGLFICYACGEKGNAKRLASHLKVGLASIDTDAAVDEVLKKVRELRQPPVKAPLIAPSWLQVWRTGDAHLERWADRGITDPQVLDRFCLGYDIMNDQLVIPVHAPDSNKMISTIRRNLDLSDGRPKYLYAKQFKISQNLYGSWQVRTFSPVSRPTAVAITEGSIDTLALWQVGIPSVALLGARVSPKQTQLLKQLDPMCYVVMTDNDRAGQQAALEIEIKLRNSGIMVTKPSCWPAGAKDPAEMTPPQRQETFFSAI